MQEAPDLLKELIRKTRTLTNKPFGVGVVLAFSHKKNIQAILDEKVALLQVSWGDYPLDLVKEAHRAGVKVVHQVSSVNCACCNIYCKNVGMSMEIQCNIYGIIVKDK